MDSTLPALIADQMLLQLLRRSNILPFRCFWTELVNSAQIPSVIVGYDDRLPPFRVGMNNTGLG